MSRIEKIDSFSLRKEELPYTQHFNYVLQNLKDPVALAIWCYLTSLPPAWKVFRCQLMKHFGIGRDKLAKALKLLADEQLIVYVQEREESGVFQGTFIHVRIGWEYMAKNEKLSTDFTALLKTRATDNPCNGESAPIKEININKENKKKERGSRKRLPLTDSFIPNEKTKAYITKKGYTKEEALQIIQKFVDWYKDDQDVLKTDDEWQEKCKNWFKKEELKPGFMNQQPKTNEIRSTVKDFVPEPEPVRTRESFNIEVEAMKNIRQVLNMNNLLRTQNDQNNGRMEAGSRTKTQ